jgi:hypothetical protein
VKHFTKERGTQDNDEARRVVFSNERSEAENTMTTSMSLTAPKLFGAKRIGDEVWLEVGTKRRKGRYIGSGRFTSAYFAGNDVFLYTFYDDHSKDILSQCWSHYKNPHLPKIELVGSLEWQPWKHSWDIQIYKTRFYYTSPRLRDMDERVVELFRSLRKAHAWASDTIEGHLVSENKCYIFNKAVAAYKGLPGSAVLALEHLTESSKYWGDHYLFDNFRSANVGLDGKGQLIFIDPLLDVKQVNEDVKRRMQKWRLEVIRR